MKKLAAAGLGLLIILALGAPFVVGSVTESSWADLNQDLTTGSAGVAVLETVEYDRGYLGADVKSKLTLLIPEFDEPVEVYLLSEVEHGLMSASAKTRLDPQHHADWLELFNGEPPVLVTNAGVGGDIDGALRISGVAEELSEGGQFRSQPVTLEFAVLDNADTVHLAFTWNGFTVQDSQSQLQVGKISVAEEMSHLMGELWIGDLSISVAEASSVLEDDSSFAFEGLSLVGGTHEMGGDRLENKVDFGIETIRVDGEDYGDLRMAFVAENFDVEATNAVMVAANQLTSVEPGDGEAAVQQLELFGNFMTAVRALMSEGLRVAIPTMVLNTPEGPVDLTFSFTHPELEPAQRENMMSLLQYSEGDLSLKVPTALLEAMPEHFQQQVFQLYQQGLLQEKDGNLLLEVELDQMTLNVNGHPIQVPPLI